MPHPLRRKPAGDLTRPVSLPPRSPRRGGSLRGAPSLRRRSTLLLLLLAVSPWLPFSIPAAGFPASPPSRTLRIATWNLDWLNRRDREGNNPRREEDYARLARYARRLDADIVALQEVDGEPAARRIFDPAVYAFHFTGDRENPQRTGFAYRRTLAVTPLPDVRDLALGGPGGAPTSP